MNTRTKIILGIVALLAVIAVGYYYGRGNAPQESANDAVAFATSSNATATLPVTPSTTSPKSKIPFGEFIKRGGTYVCTFNGAMSATTTAKGTVYTNGGNIRGDVTVANRTESGTASFIVKDGYVYYWNSAMPAGQGIKLKYDIASYRAGDFDQFDQAGNYECKPWTPESSKFNLPASIKFQEVK